MKHKFIAKRYWKDQSTAMGQSDVLAKSFDDVIDLSLGDPDLTTDFRIIDAAFADAKAGHTKYTDFRGDPELRQAIIDFYKEESEIKIFYNEYLIFLYTFMRVIDATKDNFRKKQLANLLNEKLVTELSHIMLIDSKFVRSAYEFVGRIRKS